MARLAQLLALSIKAGDTVHLAGELGAGKTTFARALIRAFLADPDCEVASPTFSLTQTYDGPRGTIAHFDLYRLSDPEEAGELGLYDSDGEAIRIIEWPDRLKSSPGKDVLQIAFLDDQSLTVRVLELVAAGSWTARLERLQEIYCFTSRAGWGDAQIAYLQGDASARRYARLTRPGASAVLMDAPRMADGPAVRDGKPYSRIAHLAEDVKPFVAVGHTLSGVGISAPRLLAHDLQLGLLLLEDLGDRVFSQETDGAQHQALLWTTAVDMLAALRIANPDTGMPVLPGQTLAGNHSLPELDATILGIEIALLPDWYWPEMHGAAMPPAVRTEFEALWRPVIELLLDEPKGWILRDVHSPNLLWLPGREGIARVGVIDFQDAIAGPWAHDVMSLLQDARVDVPASLEATLQQRYAEHIGTATAFDEAAFRTAYAAYGALRATRLLGLFVRLLRRDGKAGYLRHIGRNWAYLERNLQHPVLHGLRAWYDLHFPIDIRNRAIIP